MEQLFYCTTLSEFIEKNIREDVNTSSLSVGNEFLELCDIYILNSSDLRLKFIYYTTDSPEDAISFSIVYNESSDNISKYEKNSEKGEEIINKFFFFEDIKEPSDD